jgi:hypothetical protein
MFPECSLNVGGLDWQDAQWIIDRRAKQMKEIRDRQKSEVRVAKFRT